MTDPDFHITTPRLYLSYLQPSNPAHCDFMVNLYNTPEFIASIGGKPTSITTRSAAEALLSGRFRAEHARNGYGTLLVSLRPSSIDSSDDNTTPFSERLTKCKLIGTVSLLRGDSSTAYTAPDLGFAILPEETRKGYAKEAAECLMVWAENECGVHDVLGLFDPTNEASKGVFRSLGFEDRGVHTLREFGGVQGAVWTKKDMDSDLTKYGI